LRLRESKVSIRINETGNIEEFENNSHHRNVRSRSSKKQQEDAKSQVEAAAEQLAKEKTRAILRDNTKYVVKMERQEIKVREGASYEGAKKNIFFSKYARTN
jgi:hypothetical protein